MSQFFGDAMLVPAAVLSRLSPALLFGLESGPSACFVGAHSPWPPPFAPPTPLRSPPQTPPQWASFRFVRRLHCYYDEVRLLVSVHHRLRLLTFPMRTVRSRNVGRPDARPPRFRCDPFARDVALH